MNDSKVKVTAHEGEDVIVIGANAEYGYIRVEQERMVIDDNTGFARTVLLSALVPGAVVDLKKFNWVADQIVDGKIRIVEQMIPFNKKDVNRDIKVAGKTGIVCSKNGQPIYRKYFFTRNLALEDKLEEHTNEAEISERYSSMQSGVTAGVSPNEDFNL
jgi:hypothetical protein